MSPRDRDPDPPHMNELCRAIHERRVVSFSSAWRTVSVRPLCIGRGAIDESGECWVLVAWLPAGHELLPEDSQWARQPFWFAWDVDELTNLSILEKDGSPFPPGSEYFTGRLSSIRCS